MTKGPKAMQSGKKQRTQEMDDFYDMGDGYDEDDPFIDNTEFVRFSNQFKFI